MIIDVTLCMKLDLRNKWLKLVFRACAAPSHASTDVLLLIGLHLAN